jgi:hypothetical protein
MTLLQHHGDGQVLKLMSGSASIPLLPQARSPKADHVERYVALLTAVGVRLPADVKVVRSGGRAAVQHQWLPGTALPDLAGSDPAAFLLSVRQVATWAASLDATSARLDTNLANFVTSECGLVCIDVLPPLLTELRPPECDDWQTLFGALCYDTDITLCALAGYASRALLTTHKSVPTSGIEELAGICPGHQDPHRLPARWFHTRHQAALAALRNHLPRQSALAAFTATSVLRLRNTPPQHRQIRIDAGLAALAELSLEEPRT